MGDIPVRTVRLQVEGRSVATHAGGEGPPLLLIHGAWVGASSWSRVWDLLAAHHRVVAPELPGLGAVEADALPSVAAYARWLVAVLDALEIERATFVGNSFGGSVGWSLAGRFPERCAGLVLVDGMPMPRTPGPVLWLGRTAVGNSLVQRGLRRFSYNPRMLERAFVDTSRAPRNIPALLSDPPRAIVSRMASIVVEGDGSPKPRVEPLLVWGEGDRLLGVDVRAARKLSERLSGAQLRVIPDAGHFPQLEAPERFVSEVERWCSARDGAAADRDPLDAT